MDTNQTWTTHLCITHLCTAHLCRLSTKHRWHTHTVSQSVMSGNGFRFPFFLTLRSLAQLSPLDPLCVLRLKGPLNQNSVCMSMCTILQLAGIYTHWQPAEFPDSQYQWRHRQIQHGGTRVCLRGDFQTSILSKLDHKSIEKLLWAYSLFLSHRQDPW